MRWMAAFAAVFVLSGCSAIPTPISVATFAFDIGSYVISGKTMSDHGLSLVTQQDCQWSRITEGDICRVPLDLEEARPRLEPLSDEQVAALLDYSAWSSEDGLAGRPFQTSDSAENILMGFAESAAPVNFSNAFGHQQRMPLRLGSGDERSTDPLAGVTFLPAATLDSRPPTSRRVKPGTARTAAAGQSKARRT